MFSFLFGKKKTKKPTASITPASTSASAAVHTTAIDTIGVLQRKEMDIEKRIDALEKQSKTSHANAQEANRAGQKEKAMLFLRKRAMYDEQIKTNHAMLIKILQQRTALESTMINTTALDVMNLATGTMKAQQAEWSVDRVTSLTDDIHDAMDSQREINDLLSTPLRIDGPSEEDLAAELADMQEAEMTKSLTEVPDSITAPLPSIPVIPSMPVGEKAQGDPSGSDTATINMARELAML
jgi:hypothetical protein